MGFLVSALLTLATTDKTAPDQAVHYGRLAEGFVRSQFVHKGMTSDQVNVILGRPANWEAGGNGRITGYTSLGVTVTYSATDGEPVIDVHWYFRPFTK